MRFDEIYGHDRVVDLLRRALAAERLPHAILFHGPAGVGKGTLARALAAALLCERAGTDACGECEACDMVEHGRHPDFLVVRRLPSKIKEAASMSDAPDGSESDLSAFIRIFQIRQLNEHAAHAPREGRCRVFVVDPADRMNAESQNALLKTLEEPPGRSVLLLIASRPHLLLPTVRSRCFSVGLATIPAASLAERLAERGLPEDEALARAALSGGRPGRAISLDPEALRQRRDEMLEIVSALAGAPDGLAEMPRLTSGLAGGDDDEMLDNLDLLEGLLRDTLRAGSGKGEALLHADRVDALSELARRLGSSRAGRMVEAVERLKGDLRFNVNRTLVAESLLAGIAGGPIP